MRWSSLVPPVYYGRIPEEVADYAATITADQTPVALVVVYGNRAYDDALKEWHDLALTRGFLPVAGGAFIGEHSYSSPTYPIAAGRPDDHDLERAREFGAAIREKLSQLESPERITPICVPGSIPYCEPKNLYMLRKMRKLFSLTPTTNTRQCTQCQRCVERCPTGAIHREDMKQTDKWRCLVCFACVKACPSGARQMKNWLFTQAIKDLHRSCQERKVPEWYL